MLLPVRRLFALAITFLLLNQPLAPMEFYQGQIIIEGDTLRYEKDQVATVVPFPGRVYLAEIVPLGEKRYPPCFGGRRPLPGKPKTHMPFRDRTFTKRQLWMPAL